MVVVVVAAVVVGRVRKRGSFILTWLGREMSGGRLKNEEFRGCSGKFIFGILEGIRLYEIKMINVRNI